MSRENVEIVRRIWRIWEAGAKSGDPGAEQAVFNEGLLTPDSTFTPLQDVPGTSGRTYVGPDGLRDFVRTWTGAWAEWKISLEDVIDAGNDCVIATVHQSAIGRGSGAEVDLRFFMVFTFENGQVVDRRDYPALNEALEAVGLSE